MTMAIKNIPLQTLCEGYNKLEHLPRSVSSFDEVFLPLCTALVFQKVPNYSKDSEIQLIPINTSIRSNIHINLLPLYRN